MLTTCDDMQIHHLNKIVTKRCGIGAEKKNMAQLRLEPRASRSSCKYSAKWATEPQNHAEPT